MIAKEHLLKDGSCFVTLCGIDSEYKDDLICHFKMNNDVNCKRCIDVLRSKLATTNKEKEE